MGGQRGPDHRRTQGKTRRAGVLENGPGATDEARELLDGYNRRCPCCWPTWSVRRGRHRLPARHRTGAGATPARAWQILQGAEAGQPRHQAGYPGAYLSFNLNVNVPPPCTTGYLPANRFAHPAKSTTPTAQRATCIAGCHKTRSSTSVAREICPCETRPGKRAPTVKMCESDEQYVPLNDGYNWKGDPNATLSGQPVPQLPPGEAPARRRLPPPPPSP